MKAVFISCNQAVYERVLELLDKHFIRGYTRWEETVGRGTYDGEPHLGSHAWPSLNTTILAITDDRKASNLMASLKEMDSAAPQQGLRAFTWEVEGHF